MSQNTELNIHQLVEARRLGHTNIRHFASRVCRTLGQNLARAGAKLEYNRAIVPSCDFKLDVDIRSNRLIMYNVSGTIFLYDVAPRIFDEPYKILKSFRTRGVSSVISPNIRWGLDCSFFTLSGNSRQLQVYDSTNFEMVEMSDPRDVVLYHEHHPCTGGMVAIGNLDSVKLLDLRTSITEHLELCKRASDLPSSRVDGAMSIAWNPEDENSLVYTSRRTNYVFDIRFPRKPFKVFEFKTGVCPIHSFPLSNPCTKFVSRSVVASAYNSHFLGFYNILTNESYYLEPPDEKLCFSHESRIPSTFDVNHDGGYIYFSLGNEIVLYDIKKAEIVRYLKGHVYEIIKIKFNPLSKELFSFAAHFQCAVWSPHY